MKYTAIDSCLPESLRLLHSKEKKASCKTKVSNTKKYVGVLEFTHAVSLIFSYSVTKNGNIFSTIKPELHYILTGIKVRRQLCKI